ncbi:MAG: methionine--tRNA ligase [Firmicutes bacterium]|nr:methionine--tRNA ligase [Bacillota bacterium]
MTEKPTFYITTPIYYPSDNPHIGHAYTTVAADTMTRYKKMRGYDAYFLTGTDEHGQKIQRRAVAAGVEPQEFVDKISENFKKLWELLHIDYDDFIRTTDDRHIKYVQDLFQKIYDKGDIYKSTYEGWYCTPDEAFFTERQVGEEHICPDCGRPVERMQEESYFFKMSKYADRWLEFIEANPDFIRPESRRNEMVNFVKQGLEDLCISRTTFNWGIPVPFDGKHVVYVWFDALSNYISALANTGDGSLYNKFWPADVHLVGKDIIRFHTIIWPIMLMAAELPLPKCVLGHGWVLIDNDKMSKSKGNVVNPFVLCERYGVDAIRYFLMREMPYGQDCNYNEHNLALRINVDLANDYGNLLSRSTGMIDKFQGSIVLAPGEPTEFDAELIELAKATPARFAELMDKMEWANAIAELWKLVAKANKYIDDAAPWALNKAGEKGKLASVLYNMVEVVRLTTIMISPVMPTLAEKVWKQLGITDRTDLHTWESLTWGSFPADTKIDRGEPLFPRIDIAAMEAAAAEEAAAIDAAAAAEEAAAEEESQLEPLSTDMIGIEDFAKLDLRVVEVLECEKVPKADKLLKFRLNMGLEERTVLSGIAMHYAPEELVGKHLVLIANLAPRKIRGIESQGMLLSALVGETLQVVEVPGMTPGARIG